jgi:hypothetical protein
VAELDLQHCEPDALGGFLTSQLDTRLGVEWEVLNEYEGLLASARRKKDAMMHPKAMIRR